MVSIQQYGFHLPSLSVWLFILACNPALPTLNNGERSPFCGNGVEDPGEACDDGNDSNLDGCLITCALARCGDGFLRQDLVYLAPDEPARCTRDDDCEEPLTCSDGSCLLSPAEQGRKIGNQRVAAYDLGRIPPGKHLADAIGLEGERDWYRFTTSSSPPASLTLGTSGSLDSFCALYSDKEPFAENDDGEDQNCQLTLDNPSPETSYWLEVRAFREDQTGAYSLHITVDSQAMPEGYEQCDDGNAIGSDNCTNSCQYARCGDGVVQLGAEECDDGNANNTDACLNNCAQASCGDNIVRADIQEGQAGHEECDDSKAFESGACVTGCKLARCGDGVVRKDILHGTGGLVPLPSCERSETCPRGHRCQILTEAVLEGDEERVPARGVCHDEDEDLQETITNDSMLSAQNLGGMGHEAFHTRELLGKSGDQDWYAFQLDWLPPGLQIDTMGQLDTKCAIYDELGTLILEVDDWPGAQGNNCQLNLSKSSGKLRADQVYYLLVQGYNEAVVGSYTLHILPSPIDAPEGFEECDDGNRNNGDACVEGCRRSYCGDNFVQIEVEECDSDEDRFIGACTADCKLPRCGDGELRYDIRLPDGDVQPASACNQDFPCLRNEQCQILVEATTDDEGFPIPAAGFCRSGDDDLLAADPGGSLETAFDLGDLPPGLHGGDLIFSPNPGEADIDIYQFTLADTLHGTLQIFTSGDTDTYCTLYNTRGEAIAEVDDDPRAGESNCWIDLSPDGESFQLGVSYFIAVRGFDTETIGSYAIHVVITPDETPEGYEECDDGNSNDEDSCRDNCRTAYCGDGVRRGDLVLGEEGFEQCDDGNSVNQDGCLVNCVSAFCGDGWIRQDLAPGLPGYEECDDGELNGGALDGPDPLPVEQRDLSPCGEDCRRYPDGSSPERAAPSCRSLSQAFGGGLESGYYHIATPKLIAVGNEEVQVESRRVWCDFDSLGGNWTQCVGLRADSGIPRHFFTACAGLRPLGAPATELLIKSWHQTLGSASGVAPDQTWLIDGSAYVAGTLPNEANNPAPGQVSPSVLGAEDWTGIDGLFRAPSTDVESWLPDDLDWMIPAGPYHYEGPRLWSVRRSDAGLLQSQEGYVQGLGNGISHSETLLVAAKPRLQLDSGSGAFCQDGGPNCAGGETCINNACVQIIMERLVDAELCLGCLAEGGGVQPDCVDQSPDALRPLIWRGPLSTLCLSSSRYAADGMFQSRAALHQGNLVMEWLETGAFEIFFREPAHAVLRDGG